MIAALAVGAAGYLVGRASVSPKPAVVPVSTAPAPEPEPSPSLPPRVFGRSEIIALVASYADAAAAGLPPPAEAKAVIGRRVDVAIPFGCAGPGPLGSKAPMRWRYDAASETLRISVTPQTWEKAPWDIDRTLQGFWLSYPWTTHESCPPRSKANASSEPGPSNPQTGTLAVAELAPAEAKDAGARPRSFDLVKRLAADQLDLEHGFRLRLAGRIEALPDGEPVRCTQPQGGGLRPVCVMAMSFDELGIENDGPAGLLATWTPAQPPTHD